MGKLSATWSVNSRQSAREKLPYLHCAGEGIGVGGGKLSQPSYFHGDVLAPPTAGPSHGLKSGWRGRSWSPHGLGVPVARGPGTPRSHAMQRHTVAGQGRSGDVEVDRPEDNGPNFTLVGQS